MDATRFDTISRLFASRRTRRGAIAGGMGLAAASLGARAVAQEGTPEVATPSVDPNDPHASADDAQPNPEFLFVQPFDAGTWAPGAEEGVYTLTLSGAAAHTIYFSDRPDRIVGLSPTDQFLDQLGFTPENPPNAAIVAQREGEEEQEVLVIELLNPAYDGDTLTYDARVLADYGEHGLAHLARQQQDYELGEAFSAGSLFIDDCADGYGNCYSITNGQQVVVGAAHYGRCWSCSDPLGCAPCNDDWKGEHYGQLCAQDFPDQCSTGTSDQGYWWDCYMEG